MLGKIKWVVLAGIVVTAILLLPLIGFSAYKHGSVGMTVNIKAYRASALDAVGGNSVAISYSDPRDISYLSYIGKWWGKLFSVSGSEAPPGYYPEVMVDITISAWSEETMEWHFTHFAIGYKYTYGDTVEKTYEWNVNHGDIIDVSVWVVTQLGDFVRIDHHEIVP